MLALTNILPRQAALQFKAQGLAGLRRFTYRATLWSTVPALMLVALILTFGEAIYGLLYGEKALAHVGALWWLAPIFLMKVMRQPFHIALMTVEQTRPAFVALALSTGFSLVAVSPALSLLGERGVLAGMVGAQALSFLWLGWAGHRGLLQRPESR